MQIQNHWGEIEIVIGANAADVFPFNSPITTIPNSQLVLM